MVDMVFSQWQWLTMNMRHIHEFDGQCPHKCRNCWIPVSGQYPGSKCRYKSGVSTIWGGNYITPGPALRRPTVSTQTSPCSHSSYSPSRPPPSRTRDTTVVIYQKYFLWNVKYFSKYIIFDRRSRHRVDHHRGALRAVRQPRYKIRNAKLGQKAHYIRPQASPWPSSGRARRTTWWWWRARTTTTTASCPRTCGRPRRTGAASSSRRGRRAPTTSCAGSVPTPWNLCNAMHRGHLSMSSFCRSVVTVNLGSRRLRSLSLEPVLKDWT